MLKKLSELFGGKKAEIAPTPIQQAAPPVPNTPLEILVPEGAQLHEAPKLARKTMSFFVAATQDVNTIEYFANDRRVGSNNKDLKQFLLMVAGADQLQNLFSQCASVMYAPKMEGSIGDLACIQQGNLYSFSVFERSAPPNIKWEIHRRFRSVQIEPYGPNNSFKPTPNGAA
jgi:hypothetical protein